MKRCPSCHRTYTDASLNFCLEDGTPLLSDAAPSPPPVEIHHQPAPLLNRVDPMAQPRQWSPVPPMPVRKKSTAVWWVLGGLLVAGVLVIGAAVMLLALFSIGANSNTSANRNTNVRNSNSRVANRNSNANTNGNLSNTNSAGSLPASMSDDFSQAKWSAGSSSYGDIWYAGEQYHMRAKARSYLVMYAPSSEYNTEGATVRVTARSVDGTPALTGYGLIVHGQKTKTGAIEDYALLIYTGSEPQYEIIKHKGGTQTAVVPWTKSKVIRSGTNPNQLEVRAQGGELSFYINGQYVDRITDNENFKRGLAGLYTSDTAEVAFDDLEIER
ncbi:MAG: hypothetical protein ACR2HX_22875 [Pyrinomonadaceae bacterium]